MSVQSPRPTLRPAAAPGLPGAPGTVPPPSVPLGFLAASAVGLTGAGMALALAADRVATSPMHPGAVAAVHLTVLAFLTTAVLGAIHQFAPVVGRRPLRSVFAARVTLGGMVATAWLLPTGFAHGPEVLVATGGVVGSVTVSLAIWNLSGPLAARDGGVPVRGLRWSLGFLALTVSFGVVYAFNRQTGWFPLYPHRVLAHAHLGLLGWLGITYVSVAEKLWPMFLLSHRPRARSGSWAVSALAVGTPILAAGLLFDITAPAWVGAAIVLTGLTFHVVSLAATIAHRRRPPELLHWYLAVSVTFLLTAVILGLIALIADVSSLTRMRLVAAEVGALIAWLSLAVLGHAHKIVPFIAYSSLRAQGITTGPGGRPLLFSDLFNIAVARATLATAGVGFAAVVVGSATSTTGAVLVGGGSIAITGVLAALNLGGGPGRAARRCRALAAPATPSSTTHPEERA